MRVLCIMIYTADIDSLSWVAFLINIIIRKGRKVLEWSICKM